MSKRYRKLDGVNKYFISALTYLTEFVLFPPKSFSDETIMVDTNRGIKCLEPGFGELLRFVYIWLLRIQNVVTNREE